MILLCLAFSLVTQATPPGDRTEKERPKAPGKVYTNEDLATAKGNVTAPGAATTASEQGEKASGEKGATGESDAKREPTEEEQRERNRGDIQAKIDEQRDLIAVRRKDIEKAQQELNDFSGEVFSLAGPDGKPTGRRGALLGLVEEAQKQIQTAQETIGVLEEQARRQGIIVVP